MQFYTGCDMMDFDNTKKNEKQKKIKKDIKDATTQAQKIELILNYLNLK